MSTLATKTSLLPCVLSVPAAPNAPDVALDPELAPKYPVTTEELSILSVPPPTAATASACALAPPPPSATAQAVSPDADSFAT